MRIGDRRDRQGGFAAIGMVVVLVPILFVVGSYLNTMSGRNNRLQLEVREEQALLAAESGIDVALYHARRGAIASGAVYAETIPGGASFSAAATHLGSDGIDNDGDTLIDAADPDEDVFRIISTGRHGASVRRVAAYLGFSTFLPSVGAAATLTGTGTDIKIGGTAQSNGNNFNTNGSLVGSGNTWGLGIVPPGTVANLLSRLTPAEQAKVVGQGGSPSLGTTPAIDVTQIVNEARNAAQIVITNSVVPSPNYGNPTTGPAYIVYRQGNVRFTGNGGGAGLLVVTGDLTISGTFRWYGLIVVLGKLDCGSGTAQLYGGVILGPSSNEIDLRGTIDVRYSAPAIALAQNLTGRYVAFNGWQEISTN
jgi:hypothetical protein